MNNKFILGTAQLGMPYGIANTHGQPSLDVAKQIVGGAVNDDIYYFDTAQAYGTSEKVLGECLLSLNIESKAKIITKVASENLHEKQLLEQALYTSMQNLYVNSLYCFMFHHEEYLPFLDAWQGDFLVKMQEKGTIKKIGISVYAVEKALEALEHPFVQIVQVPSSLFDRRFIDAGIFEKAKELGKEIHIRSVFLQGVLCMPSEKLPKCLQPLKEYIDIFQALCKEYACSFSQAALFYMQNKEPDSYLIFGAESSTQIMENLDKKWQTTADLQAFYNKLEAIKAPQETKLLNPALWEK